MPPDVKLALAPLLGLATTLEPVAAALSGAGMSPLAAVEAMGFGASGTWAQQVATKSGALNHTTRFLKGLPKAILKRVK